jgi:hypothetical protein
MPHRSQNRIILSVALLLPCTASLWLLTVPGTMGPSTYAVLAGLIIATAAIGLNSWKNSQPTGSMGQLIHETDMTPRAITVPEATSASRWDAWQRRGDALAQTGRVRALLALSVAVTGTLFYAWFA